MRIIHALGILAMLIDVERENGLPIEHMTILGNPLSHWEPFHHEMSATLFAIEPTDHGI